MRRLGLLFLLTLVGCEASTIPTSVRKFRNEGRESRLSGDSLDFEFLPASGAGAPVAQDLCDVVQPGDEAGNWWCLSGAGVSSDADGGVVLSPVGSPTTQTRPLCSNGLNCADVTNQRFDGTDDRYATGSIASPAGDYSCVVAVSFDATPVLNAPLIDRDRDDGTNKRSFHLLINPTPAPSVTVCSGEPTPCTTVTGSALSARPWYVIGFSYDYVTAGTSALRLYVDGASVGTPSTTATGPMMAWSGDTRVGSYKAIYWLAGAMRGAFCTEKVLSAADMTRLAAAVQSNLTGSKGEALTFTRASAQFCENGSGSGTTMANGKPCVAQGGYLSEASAENKALNSEVVASQGCTGFTADSDTSPDGTLTADSRDIPDATEACVQNLDTGAALANTTWTLSAYCQSKTGSTQDIYLGATDAHAWAAGQAAQASCDCPAAPAWTRCSVVVAYTSEAVGNTAGLVPWSTTGWLGNSNKGGNRHVTVWGRQFEKQAFATSYIRTEGSAVTRVATALKVTSPAPFVSDTFSLRVGYSPLAAVDVTSPYMADTRASGSAPGIAFYRNANNTVDCFVTDGIAFDKARTPVQTLVVGTTYSYRCIRGLDGVAHIYRDGVLQSGSTPVPSPYGMNGLTIGGFFTGITQAGNAYISNTCLSSRVGDCP